MAAIPMMNNNNTDIAPPTVPSSKLKRSPYLSSMCVDDNGRSETAATTSSPRHLSISIPRHVRRGHGHSPRPTTCDAFELRRPAASHPYLLPDNDGGDGDSGPSSAASTETTGNRSGRVRPRRGGGKIAKRRGGKNTSLLSSFTASGSGSNSVRAPASSCSSVCGSSASHLRYYYPHPFSRADSLLTTATATSKGGEDTHLSCAFDRIRIDNSSPSSASSASSLVGNDIGGANGDNNDVGTNARSSHDEIANWIRQHYNPSRGTFFRRVLDPMDGPSDDVNKKLRNEQWKEILLLDDDDWNNDDNDSSLASTKDKEDANKPCRYPNRRSRRIPNNSISNGNASRNNLSSSFRSASRISFSSLSSFASAHSLPLLLAHPGVVADPDDGGHNNDNDDDSIVVDSTPRQDHRRRQEPQEAHVRTTKNAGLFPSFPRSPKRNGARVVPLSAATFPTRRSASHAGLAYGTEYCREGHGSFASLSGSMSLLSSVTVAREGEGGTAGVATSGDR